MNKTEHCKSRLSGLIPLAFAALIAISPFAQANSDGAYCDHKHWGQDKHSELFQKHQKELHDMLALTASQEAAWNTFAAKTGAQMGHKQMNW